MLSLCAAQEQEQLIRHNKRLEEELLTRQRQEKIRLPKIQRTEGKARMSMFKQSLRIQAQQGEAFNEKEKVRQVCVRVAAGFFTGKVNDSNLIVVAADGVCLQAFFLRVLGDLKADLLCCLSR